MQKDDVAATSLSHVEKHRDKAVTEGAKDPHLRRRLSCTMHSTLSQRQLPHGNCSTTSQRTLRALQEAQARAARRLVTLALFPPESDLESHRFLD